MSKLNDLKQRVQTFFARPKVRAMNERSDRRRTRDRSSRQRRSIHRILYSDGCRTLGSVRHGTAVAR